MSPLAKPAALALSILSLCWLNALFVSPAVLAQTQSATDPAPAPDRLPQFEVATIKPVDKTKMIENGTEIDEAGRVTLEGLNLKAMIGEAFDMRYWQIEGGEAWVEKDQFNVVAQPPEGFRLSKPDTRHTLFDIEDDQLRQMLQSLLIDRFHLKFHRETRSGKVYLLERTSKPLLLQPTKDIPPGDDASSHNFGSIGFAGNWVLASTTLPQLAKFASAYMMHTPVLNRTGLAGAFDYRSPPEDWNTYQSDMTGSFMRMLHEIGLRLEPSDGPVEFLVIDHAEPPTPN